MKLKKIRPVIFITERICCFSVSGGADFFKKQLVLLSYGSG
jgi:hypothetical protein